jgi:hypothetical protein
MSFLTQDLSPQTLDQGITFGALVIGVILAAVSVNPPLATQSKLTALSPSQPISRSSLFGATNVQALIYFQTHTGGTGMTFYKLVVRPCCLRSAQFFDITSGHLALVRIARAATTQHC